MIMAQLRIYMITQFQEIHMIILFQVIVMIMEAMLVDINIKGGEDI